MDALAESHERRRGRLIEPAHVVDPGTCCVDDVPRVNLNRAAVTRVDCDRTAAVVAQVEAGHPRVVEHERARPRRGLHRCENEPRVDGLGLLEHAAHLQAIRAQRGHEAACGRRADQRRSSAPARQRLVKEDAGGDRARSLRRAAIGRQHERHRPHQVGRDRFEQHRPLALRLAHQRDVAHRKVAEASVHEL